MNCSSPSRVKPSNRNVGMKTTFSCFRKPPFTFSKLSKMFSTKKTIENTRFSNRIHYLFLTKLFLTLHHFHSKIFLSILFFFSLVFSFTHQHKNRLKIQKSKKRPSSCKISTIYKRLQWLRLIQSNNLSPFENLRRKHVLSQKLI